VPVRLSTENIKNHLDFAKNGNGDLKQVDECLGYSIEIYTAVCISSTIIVNSGG
jgi:hypothetical protein